MTSAKFLYTLKVHNGVYPIDKYLFDTIDLHYKEMNLINWKVSSKGKKAIDNDANHYQTEVEIDITVENRKDFFNIKTGLFFILSKDPNLEILSQECSPNDIYS